MISVILFIRHSLVLCRQTTTAQGWVSHRASELTVGGVTSDIFSEYLRREGAVYTTPSYTGRIAETFWMHGGQPSGTYVLNYDGFGRLRDGWHYLYGNPVNAWSERNITYDRNDNVLSLLRYGSSGTMPTNNYTISYEGNRALLINGTAWYEYDFNGNVTGDAAREYAIGYNVLNLPSWFNDGESDLMVFYDYLADGTKVALHREDTGMGRAWLGDLVFNLQEDARDPEDPGDGSRGARTSTLSKRDTTGKYLKVVKNVNLRGPEEDEEEGAYYSFESTPYAGGRIESIGNGIKVRKYVTDHLGSIRAIVTDNAVVERNDYYPFGGRHDNPSLTTLTSNRYGFSGKEQQNISTGLAPYLDFGARFYDPVIGRWLQQDPMAGKYHSLTQYNYCGNNPENFVDEEGKKIVFAENASPEFKKAFARTVKYMNSRGTAGNLAVLEASPIIYTIAEASDGKSRFQRSTKTIYWDYLHIAETSSSMWISPATALDHETEHAKRYDSAVRSSSKQEKRDYANKNQKNSDVIFDTIEEKEIITDREQKTARKHHEINNNQVTRTDHGIRILNGSTRGLNPNQIEKIVKKHNELL